MFIFLTPIFQGLIIGCSKQHGTYGDPCGSSATYEFHEECAEGYYCEGYYPSFPRSHWAGEYCYCEDPESPDCDEPNRGCAADEIEDCYGWCSPLSWLGDGLCEDEDRQDNRRYTSPSGHRIDVHFNCPQLNYDEGDCEGYNNIFGEPSSETFE